MKLILILTALVMTVKGQTQNPKHAEAIDLNGTVTYYEVYGQGRPLFLLHGFTQSSKFWFPQVTEYDREFQVYLVDLMGHGKSDPFKETISVKSAAQNLLDLIKYLKLDSIQAIGFSYGGEILFQLALLEPNLIKSMIIIGSCGSWHAKDFPEFIEYLSMKNLANLSWMLEQQINEERIKNILEQMPNYSISISIDELASIQTPTLLIVGDSDDATPLECVIKAKSNMPNAYLWIAPNSGHRVHQGQNQDQFARTSRDFLNNTW